MQPLAQSCAWALLGTLGAFAALIVLFAAQPAGHVTALAEAAGRPLTEKLEDVFTAPLDALATYVHRVDAISSAGAEEQRARPTLHLSHGSSMRTAGGSALASFFHNEANAGRPQGPATRGWGLPGMGGWGQTGNWGDSGRLRAEHGNFDGHRSAMRLPLGIHPYTRHHGEAWHGVRTGRSNDFQVISTGPRTPDGFSTQYGTQYSKSEQAPLPVGPAFSGWDPYDISKGKSGETHFASIRVDDYACGGPGKPPCKGKAHLKLDVYCPPYEAPDHGSVWYKGKEYLEATSTAPASRSMIHLPVGGDCSSAGAVGDCAKGVPAAVVGVDIPEGDHVQVSCREHYRLTGAGSEFPRCLKSGQFEKGKQCEPIMCSAYKPPENGGVWPDTPVQAGERVEVYCFEGYEEDYDDYWPFQKTLPRRDFDAGGKRFDKAATSTLRGIARVRAAIKRLQHVAQMRGASSALGGTAGDASIGLTRGRGRVRHPDMAALFRAKAAARVRRRREDRGRMPSPEHSLPVIPMDDVMAGSQKTLDAMVRSFVATGDAGFQPGWSDKRLSYPQALSKQPSTRGSSSSYALQSLEAKDATERQPHAEVSEALRRQNLDMTARGLDDKYHYAVKAKLDKGLEADYRYALLDAAQGADDKLMAALDAHRPSSSRRLLDSTPEQSVQDRNGKQAEPAPERASKDDEALAGPRRNPMYRKPWVDKPKKKPMCLDSTQYERGITCRPLPATMARGPEAGAPPTPPGEFRQAPTTTSVPEQWRDFPPVASCPPYIAPRHGSAWYKTREYRIATPKAQEREIVTLTCDENYRLSDRGSRWPECLHDGHWDKGKTCEPLMCPPYQPPEHGSVDICESVQAGTRVTISCDTYFMAYGEETGGRRSPKCLPDGSYEKGIECIPRPCPKKNKIPMPEDEPCDSEAHALEAHPPAVKISHHQIKDWEQGLQRQDVYDYTPNVFDHEPRPYQIPQGMEDWRVHEGNTVVGGGNDGDGVLIRDDVGARWPTHQTGESDSPRHATWKGPWGFAGEPKGKGGVTPPLDQIGV